MRSTWQRTSRLNELRSDRFVSFVEKRSRRRRKKTQQFKTDPGASHRQICFRNKEFWTHLWFKKLSLVPAFYASHFLEKRNKKKQKQKLHLEPILWSDRLASRFLSQETNKNYSLEIFIVVKNSSPGKEAASAESNSREPIYWNANLLMLIQLLALFRRSFVISSGLG